ncbi:hypothetical protein EW026_g1612 [Hermanssonia centrifuga]|uniref:CUE domain-containing protein n=1 Tax=Hermanssonia centrifuga TaxID=98765 RepID=A0A4S4KQX2_9APHY|nr:hypothetical protein EW026_g1612 [Hermanssonia centrifuga]
MGEVVNVLVAFAVIVFVFKWATSSKDSPADAQSPAAILGFRPKNITQEQVDTVHAMFPDIPRENIHFELLRSGNVQQTSNKILERGFLPAPPPAYYTIYPRTATPDAPRPGPAANTNQNKSAPQPKENLISRYRLENRLDSSAASSATEDPLKWDDSPEKREAGLRERKARMVLAARQRLLAQQQNQASSSEASST